MHTRDCITLCSLSTVRILGLRNRSLDASSELPRERVSPELFSALAPQSSHQHHHNCYSGRKNPHSYIETHKRDGSTDRETDEEHVPEEDHTCLTRSRLRSLRALGQVVECATYPWITLDSIGMTTGVPATPTRSSYSPPATSSGLRAIRRFF